MYYSAISYKLIHLITFLYHKNYNTWKYKKEVILKFKINKKKSYIILHFIIFIC
jgi:hypothetical protein